MIRFLNNEIILDSDGLDISYGVRMVLSSLREVKHPRHSGPWFFEQTLTRGSAPLHPGLKTVVPLGHGERLHVFLNCSNGHDAWRAPHSKVGAQAWRLQTAATCSRQFPWPLVFFIVGLGQQNIDRMPRWIHPCDQPLQSLLVHRRATRGGLGTAAAPDVEED